MAARRKIETRIIVEFEGKKIQCGDVAERIKLREKSLHPTQKIDSMDVYIQPENGCAYYVVNGKGGDDNKISV